MGDYVHIAFWIVWTFIFGATYGRMKGQKAEDELRMKIAELNAQNRLMQRLQDRIESKLD